MRGGTMRKGEVEQFNKTYAQLEALHSEISLLSKKSPVDAVNKFKLKLINSVLESANNLLGQRKPFEDFTIFDENELPNNSDVTMILSQYLGCMEEIRVFNIQPYVGSWYWKVDGRRSEIRTFSPKK